MTPDLLNFKKGWMSILDEPGEWKKHWFVLTDSSLKYYRDSTAEEADELDGEIDLRSCTDVTEYAVQRNYGFQIHVRLHSDPGVEGAAWALDQRCRAYLIGNDLGHPEELD